MCGIFGTTKSYSKEVLDQKLLLMKHRGPDFQGVEVFDEFVTFGQVRLSIIDLNQRSNQPFTYRHVSITFNGEIYNFQKLRSILKDKGYKFDTESDTEVLCAMYIEYGESMVSMLNGMFAFTIYDRKKNVLFGARDRMGQKPFFYALKDDSFEFSSQLFTIGFGNKNEINRSAIKQFLDWGYVPEPLSMYTDVYKLKASHYFIFDLDSRKFESIEYGKDLEVKTEISSFKNSVVQLDNLLNEAVRTRLVSDVPLGVFLSGGVDSSLIAALAQKNSDNKIKTFSVGFQEASFDETQYAEIVSKHLKTDHHKIILSSTEGLDLLQDFESYFDEPFFDTSSFGQMLLSRETRKHVTVALTGDGGDELFLGYNRYKTLKERARFFEIPYFLRKVIANGMYNFKSYGNLNNIYSALRSKSIEGYYIESMTNRDRSWLNFEPEQKVEYLDLLYSDKDLLERVSDFEMKTYMNGDIHTKVDRATMKYSLEARSPFMDKNVVSFSRQLPTSFKMDNGVGKRVLKEVLYNYVPKQFFERKKAGFSVPLAMWLRLELKDWVYDLLTEKNLELIPEINKGELMKMVEKHMSGSHDFSLKIWSVISLINWMNFNRNLG
jgi:asparagine synthase (glutamine-hydrolysing)